MTEELSIKHKKMLGIAAIAVAVLFSAAIFFFIGSPLVSLVSKPKDFRLWVNNFGIWGKLIFVGMIILQVIVAIIPGEPFEIAAGYAFGAVEGTILCLIGAVIGSALIFMLVRRFGVILVEIFFSKEKIESLKFLNNSKKISALFFIIMLIPGTPKDLLSYFAPLTKMKFSAWMLIVSITRIPSIITSSIGGSALGEQKYVFAAVAFAVTLLISGIGLLIYRKIQADKNKDNNS